ncbi:MAG: SEL1-like repeat protein [Bacteroidota bacterium]
MPTIQQQHVSREAMLQALERRKAYIVALQETLLSKKKPRSVSNKKSPKPRSSISSSLSVTQQDRKDFRIEGPAQEVPQEYFCALTGQVMRKPVVLIREGESYERKAVTKWLKQHRTHPITKKRVDSKKAVLIDNIALRKVIEAFQSQRDRLLCLKLGAECVEELIATARQGDAKAQFQVGHMYRTGDGTQRDQKKAFEWFERAAQSGHARAQRIVGSMYRDGQGVEKDYKKAIRWYESAASQANSRAQLCLGDMHEDGLGTAKDAAVAKSWYAKALKQALIDAPKGDVDAQYSLGWMY